MLKFSARYARKVQYCDIACRARRKNYNFSYVCPSNPKHGSTPLSGLLNKESGKGRSILARKMYWKVVAIYEFIYRFLYFYDQ